MKLAAIVIALCFGLALVVSGVDRTVHVPDSYSAATLAIRMTADLAPGGPRPDHDVCDYRHYINGGYVPCYTYHNNLEVDYIYNLELHIVTEITYQDGQDKVGDIILAWGPPNGYLHEEANWFLYWNDRSAMVSPKYGFSIFSPVTYVRIGTPDKDYQKWTTFPDS